SVGRLFVVLALCACGRHGFTGSEDAAIDVAAPDVARDAAPSPPMIDAMNSGRAVGASQLTIPLAIGAGSSHVLLVTIELGSHCADPSVPTVASVIYGSAPLTSFHSILGTPCNANVSRSELWTLIAPPAGQADVAIALTGMADAVHGEVLSVAGVDPAAP